MVIVNLILQCDIMAQTEIPEDEYIKKNETFLEEFNYFRNFPGLEIKLDYKGELFSNLSGGMKNETVYLDNIDLIFNLDLEDILGLEGTNLSTHILGNHG